jgi:hypothetical protein
MQQSVTSPPVVYSFPPLLPSHHLNAHRDPFVVGRARMGAQTIAEVVNGFFDVISWRTMVRLLLLVLPPLSSLPSNFE